MTNRARGDAELEAGGRRYTLRLTLGALAEIEDGLSLDDLSGIEARLKNLRAAISSPRKGERARPSIPIS